MDSSGTFYRWKIIINKCVRNALWFLLNISQLIILNMTSSNLANVFVTIEGMLDIPTAFFLISDSTIIA